MSATVSFGLPGSKRGRQTSITYYRSAVRGSSQHSGCITVLGVEYRRGRDAGIVYRGGKPCGTYRDIDGMVSGPGPLLSSVIDFVSNLSGYKQTGGFKLASVASLGLRSNLHHSFPKVLGGAVAQALSGPGASQIIASSSITTEMVSRRGTMIQSGRMRASDDAGEMERHRSDIVSDRHRTPPGSDSRT